MADSAAAGGIVNPRHALHARGVAYVVRQLRRRGCRALPTIGLVGAGGVTFTVVAPCGDRWSAAVRVARRRMVTHRVTVGGRRYSFNYPTLHWNLHVHGRRGCQPQVWVLVAIGRPMRVFVVPAAVIGSTAKTMQLLDTASAGQHTRRRARARVRAYLDRWEVIVGRLAGERAA